MKSFKKMELSEVEASNCNNEKDLALSSALLSPKLFENSSETLGEHLRRIPSVYSFLRFLGVIWTVKNESQVTSILQVTWNGLLRLSLAIPCGIAFVFTVFEFSVAGTRLLIYSLTLFLQCLALCFALYDIRSRLLTPISVNMIPLVGNGLSTSIFTFILSVLLALVPVLVSLNDLSGDLYSYLILIFGEYSICSFLASAMFFITFDCACATKLMNQLMEQLKLETLTFEQFSLCRDEIERVKMSSLWINNCIVIVALLDLVSVLLLLVHYIGSYKWYVFLSLYIKEIPFLCVVYWQVAKVNEKSARFMEELGSVRWSAEGNRDAERVAIFVNVQSKPIVMSLAGMKLKRVDLMWQFAGWCVAFAVGIFKSVVESRA